MANEVGGDQLGEAAPVLGVDRRDERPHAGLVPLHVAHPEDLRRRVINLTCPTRSVSFQFVDPLMWAGSGAAVIRPVLS
jgi:hypothetical protein